MIVLPAMLVPFFLGWWCASYVNQHVYVRKAWQAELALSIPLVSALAVAVYAILTATIVLLPICSFLGSFQTGWLTKRSDDIKRSENFYADNTDDNDE